MNEKTTKSDLDLKTWKMKFAKADAISNDLRVLCDTIIIKARKMEFLENFLAFAEHARERLLEKFPRQNINHKHLDFFIKDLLMSITLYKDGKYVSLEWHIKYEGYGIKANMYTCDSTHVNYEANPDILEKFVQIPFEEFTNTFEKLFAELEGEPEKISIDVTPEQLDKINEHGII